MKGWEDGDTFRVFIPATAIDIEKAGDKDGKRWIQGIASTDSKDIQGEIIDQNGIDFSYFLKHGWFNDDHKSGPENKVGQPTECRITRNGLWVKGFLFNNHSRANHYWELMNSLASSGSSRKVGFSIQGKVKRRNGNKIAECWIQDVALTPSPVNTTTWAEIAKSLSSMEWDFNKSNNENSEEEEDENKALTAGDSPLVPESLDRNKKEDRTSKSFTYEEAVNHLVINKSLPKEAAIAVVDVVFDLL